MIRTVYVSLVAFVALSVGSAVLASDAEAKKKHHHRQHYDDGLPLSFFLGFPGHDFHPRNHLNYYYYEDCGYRRVTVKKWNKAHTKRIKIHQKRWVCY